MNNHFPTLGPIVIGVRSINAAKPFYLAVFGIQVQDESPGYLSANLTDGTHIELEEWTEHRFPNWKEHSIGTYKNSELEVADINGFLEAVVTHGGKIISYPVERPWGGFGAEFADPDGNMFLVSQR